MYLKRKYALLASIWMFAFGLPFITQGQSTVTKIENGYIKGISEDKSIVFRGIPYAAPAIGKARFMPPTAHANWPDTLDCLKFGSSSAQYGGDQHPVNGSENGLFLNVYTPTLSQKAKLPVLVWVHGGSMVAGSGNGENGHAFSDNDSIVTVTINYRLGVFGFLYLGDLGPAYKTSGNNGLLDLMQALKWVKNNIQTLGGDPSRVTVMGESAGAKLSSALIASPKAKGLFSGVILESGGFQCIRDTATAKGIRQRLMNHLGVHSPRELLQLPTDVLIKAQAKVLVGAQGTNYFGPVMDGIILNDHPYAYIDQEGENPVHYLLGANQKESKIFMDMDKRLYHPDSTVLSDWFGINYKYSLEDYHKRLAELGSDKDTLAATQILSQYMYQMHTSRLANRLAAADRSTWVYRYSFPPATHGNELQYVWYLPEKRQDDPATQRFGKQLHQYWVNFIKKGDPGTVNNTHWPSYLDDNHSVIVLDKKIHSKELKHIFNNPGNPSACFLLSESSQIK